MVENSQTVKSLRRGLEEWREILVALYSVLTWEKQYHSAIIGSVISFIFLLLWYIDPAVLTLLAFVGIIAVLLDFLIPQVMPMIYGQNQWSGSQERKYEQVINSLVEFYESLTWLYSTLRSMKSTKPKTFFFVVTGFLLLCAWIGSSINNFFLTYLITLLSGLFPGLRRQKPVKKWLDLAGERACGVMKGLGPEQTSDEKETKKE